MYNNVIFDGYDLTDIEGLKINSVTSDVMPEIFMSSSKLARVNSSATYNREYGGKTIPIKGHIQRNTRKDYLNTRSQLLKKLQTLEGTLQIPIDGNPIEYTCTVKNVSFDESMGGYGAFTIDFYASDPYGYDMNSRTIINGSTVTTASSDISFSEAIGGADSTPFVLLMTLGSMTGGTSKYIDISNQDGDNLRITRTWSNNDTIYIDSKTKTCTVNGALVDYTGNFFNLNVDDTTFSYADNLTTRSVNVLLTYKRRYL
jgi:phage-related protein